MALPATGTSAAAGRPSTELTNDAMSALFQGLVEATEEAIYNSMLAATTVTSRGRTVEALPVDRVLEVLRRYGVGSNLKK